MQWWWTVSLTLLAVIIVLRYDALKQERIMEMLPTNIVHSKESEKE